MFYRAALGKRPRSREVSPVAALAINLADAYEKGILPGAGGYMDQDWFYVSLIIAASNARGRQQRQHEEHRKR